MALVAGREGYVGEVVAAGALHQVAARAGHVSELRRSAAQECLREQRLARLDQRMVGKIALWKSLLTAFLFTALMFVTFDIAFDVIMPKGPLEAAFGY